jgi:hypothetical protein
MSCGIAACLVTTVRRLLSNTELIYTKALYFGRTKMMTEETKEEEQTIVQQIAENHKKHAKKYSVQDNSRYQIDLVAIWGKLDHIEKQLEKLVKLYDSYIPVLQSGNGEAR